MSVVITLLVNRLAGRAGRFNRALVPTHTCPEPVAAGHNVGERGQSYFQAAVATDADGHRRSDINVAR